MDDKLKTIWFTNSPREPMQFFIRVSSEFICSVDLRLWWLLVHHVEFGTQLEVEYSLMFIRQNVANHFMACCNCDYGQSSSDQLVHLKPPPLHNIRLTNFITVTIEYFVKLSKPRPKKMINISQENLTEKKEPSFRSLSSVRSAYHFWDIYVAYKSVLSLVIYISLNS